MPNFAIKPLVWDADMARDPFGDYYEIEAGDGGTFEIEHPRLFNGYFQFKTKEAAKSAAQADHEARILAAIDAVPAAQIADEALERAAQPFDASRGPWLGSAIATAIRAMKGAKDE